MASSRGGSRPPYPRTARLNQILREVISETILRLGDVDDRFGMLTVTGVETSPDVAQAVVYLHAISPAAREALDERRGQIQASINAQTRLKRTPKITFVEDPAIAAGSSVEDAIRRLHEDDDES